MRFMLIVKANADSEAGKMPPMELVQPMGVQGPEAGLAAAEALAADPALKTYHRVSGVRGEFLLKLGRHDEARAEFERAASLTQNAAERALLAARARECGVSRRT